MRLSGRRRWSVINSCSMGRWRPGGRSATPRDVDVRFVLANPALAELVARAGDCVSGLSDGEVFPPLTADEFHRNKRDDPEIGLSSVK